MLNIINHIKTHKVEVEVTGPFLNHFLINLYRLHININNVKYLKEDKISFITDYDNIEKISANFKDYKIKIKNHEGIYKIRPFIIRNKIFLSCLVLGLFLLAISQNIIVKVDVIHSDKDIRQLVKEELEYYHVKSLTFKKSYKQLQEIKQKILDKYPDKLEWIEIENVGMTYKVRIEQRIITKIKDNNNLCNIVAQKSGIITKIINKQGMNIKTTGDYVSKGDIIIAGDIKTAEDEVKNRVCATGEVYAEIWLTANVSLPLNYKEKQKTGEKRWNFMIDTGKEKKILLKNRFKNSIIKNKKLFKVGPFTFYKQTEYEVKIKNKKYNLEQAEKEALSQALSKVKMQLNDKERIITQKVLNKDVKNSKMKIEVFVSVEKQIGKQVNYVPQLEQESS